MKKIIIAAIVIVPTTIVALRAYLAGHDNVLQERFPDLDPELVQRAHRTILKDSLAGKLDDVSDEALDAKLIKLVESYQK